MATDNGNTDSDQTVIIKKYANRRLYNTATSSYVTLDHLAQMVRQGVEFQVVDAKSGEDITRSVLTQIIFEAESKEGASLLPIGFLRRLINYYGDSLQPVVPSYLEMSMEAFAHNQDQMRQNLQEAFGQPFKQFEELTRLNMEAFQNSMQMFNPFAPPAKPTEAKPKPAPPKEDADEQSELTELKVKLAEMQNQLNRLLEDK